MRTRKVTSLSLAALVGLSFLLVGCPSAAPPSGNQPPVAGITGGPAFIINNPSEGAALAGPTFFSLQPLDPSQVASVRFEVGGAVVTPSLPGENALRVFLVPADHPEGPLRLRATMTGHDGRRSEETRWIDVVRDPPSAAVVSRDGAVLGTREANGALSTLTVPPGVAQGATVRFEARTQEQVRHETGVDYDALGVTFLGAQEIVSDRPLGAAGMVNSGGFGPMVQPGQAVVQYMIMPDGDGDGIGELVVVNTATVAPNGDVISDPIAGLQIADSVGVRGAAHRTSVSTTAGTLIASPGEILELRTTGLNPFTVMGNVALFRSQAVAADAIVMAHVRPADTGPSRQMVTAVVPPLPPGPARLYLVNLSTRAVSGGLDIEVGLPLPLRLSVDDVFDTHIARLSGLVADSTYLDPSIKATLLDELADVRASFAELLSDPDLPDDVRVELENAARLLQHLPDVTSSVSTLHHCRFPWSSSADVGMNLGSLLTIKWGAALTAVGVVKDVSQASVDVGTVVDLVILPFETAEAAAQPGSYYARVLGRIGTAFKFLNIPLAAMDADRLGRELALWRACMRSHDDDDDDTFTFFDPSQNECAPPPPMIESIEEVPPPRITGMGSAPPPGGCAEGTVLVDLLFESEFEGLARTATDTRTPSLAGRFSIKVYTRGRAAPFTGVTDATGYFHVPFIAKDEPFIAVATDAVTGATRSIEGIGPATGEATTLLFDFVAAPVPDTTVRWTGEGDGRSWRDAFNWHGGLFPGPDDDVVITRDATSGSIVFDVAAAQVASLRIEEGLVVASGTLRVASSLRVEGSLTIERGHLDVEQAPQVSDGISIDGGILQLHEAATFDVPVGLSDGRVVSPHDVALASGFLWAGGTLDVAGMVHVTGGMHVFGASPKHLDGSMVLASDSTWTGSGWFGGSETTRLTNRSESTLTLRMDPSSSGFGTGWLTVVNEGDIVVDADGGVTRLSVHRFENRGALAVERGTLEVYAFESSNVTGVFAVEATAALVFASGEHDLTGATFEGPGTVELAGWASVTSGTLRMEPDFVMRSGGRFDGEGDVVLDGHVTWSGGEWSGSGTTRFTGGLVVEGASSKRLCGRSLEVVSDAVWRSEARLTMCEAATLEIGPEATLDIQTDTTVEVFGSATVRNLGTITKSGGTGMSPWFATVNNDGLIDVSVGTLSLMNNSVDVPSVSGGQFVVAAGARLELLGNRTVVTASGSVAGSGDTTLGSFGTVPVQIDGSYTVTGVTRVTGTVAFDTSATFGGLEIDASGSRALLGRGDLVVNGVLRWVRGTIDGTGTLTANGGVEITGSDDKWLYERTLVLASDTVWSGAGILRMNGGVIENQAGRELEVLVDARIETSFGGSPGTIVNAGRIHKTGGTGVATWLASVSNDGLIEVSAGSLYLSYHGSDASSVSGGAFVIAAGAHLELFGCGAMLSTASSVSGAGDVTLGGVCPGSEPIRIEGDYGVTGVTRVTGSVAFDTNATLGGLEIDASGGGALLGRGDLVVDGALQWVRGTIGGTGTLTVNGGLSIEGGGFDTKWLSDRTLDLASDTVWSGDATLRGSGSTIRVQTGRVLELQVDAAIGGDGSGGHPITIVNAGRIHKTGGNGVANWFVCFVDDGGSVDVSSGSLNISEPSACP